MAVRKNKKAIASFNLLWSKLIKIMKLTFLQPKCSKDVCQWLQGRPKFVSRFHNSGPELTLPYCSFIKVDHHSIMLWQWEITVTKPSSALVREKGQHGISTTFFFCGVSKEHGLLDKSPNSGRIKGVHFRSIYWIWYSAGFVSCCVW